MKISTDQDATPQARSTTESIWLTTVIYAAGGGALVGVFGQTAAIIGAIAGGIFGLIASRAYGK